MMEGMKEDEMEIDEERDKKEDGEVILKMRNKTHKTAAIEFAETQKEKEHRKYQHLRPSPDPSDTNGHSTNCLRSRRSSNGLDDASDLTTGTNDASTSRVGDIVDILVLTLSLLPDFDFAAAADDANTEIGEEVVSSVGV